MSQTPDIVERLRKGVLVAQDKQPDIILINLDGTETKCGGGVIETRQLPHPDAIEAADTIEALRSEVTDLQNTIARLTREIGSARDTEAAEIVAWLRRDTPEPSHLKAAGPRIVAACALDFADAITRHEHRKD